MRTRTLILILFGLGMSYSLWPQADLSGHKTYTHSLTSDTGRSYLIKVTPPLSYNESTNYPVLFYLDAWWLEDIVKGSYMLLQRIEAVEDVILVGISLEASEYDFVTQRTLDYTPSPYDIDVMGIPFIIPLKPKSFQISKDNSGQSAAFTDFLLHKIIPMLIKNYRVNEQEFGLLGHSLGGLFGINTLSTKPYIFNKFIVIAPALWWNKSKAYYEPLEQRLINAAEELDLFMCMGEKEGIPIAIWTKRLDTFLQQKKYTGFNYKFEIYGKADHTSVLPQSIYDGLVFLYGKK